MIPIILELGPVKIYSFGLMVLVAFGVGARLVILELRRRGMVPNHLEGYPMFALIGGIVGARLYWMLEHPAQVARDPFGSIIGGAGLTWYGGLVGGALAALWLARRKKQSLWQLCDAFAPGLAAAYMFGRVGCHLSGDGDYGPPTDVPWAVSYEKGVVPTPPGVLVHPTPIYEILMMLPIVLVLWMLRTRAATPGWLFGVYLVLVGIERWIAEIYRVRTETMLGMSTAQWFSVLAILAGLYLAVTRFRPSSGTAPRS